MMARRAWRVLVATDGSRGAREAVAAVTRLPWPPGLRVTAVTARGGSTPWGPHLRPAVDASVERALRRAHELLRARWRDAEARVLDAPPVEGILAEARRIRADVIVVGSRGHGALTRLVLGSVSLGVVRGAACSVLVVKRPLERVGHVVLGLDGSAPSRRATTFLAGLTPDPGSQVSAVAVVEPVRPPSLGLLPRSVRDALGGEIARLTTARQAAARREIDGASRTLARTGWSVRPALRSGVPLAELLRVVADGPADLLVIGARGTGGMARLLLGSVSDGALSRCPVPVLIVR